MKKTAKKIKNNIFNKPKINYFTKENVGYILFAVLCVALIAIAHFSKNVEFQKINDFMPEILICTSIIDLLYNYIKYKYEALKIHSYCEGIVDLSYMLFYDLNEYLTLNGRDTIDDIFDLKNDEYIEKLDLRMKKRNYIVFDIVLKKFSQINDMQFLKKNDVFVVIYEDASSKKSKEKSFNQNFIDLLKLLRSMNTLFKKQNYIEGLNSKIKESAKNLREENIHYYSDYIDQCLENDLAEKQSYYARGEYT